MASAFPLLSPSRTLAWHGKGPGFRAPTQPTQPITNITLSNWYQYCLSLLFTPAPLTPRTTGCSSQMPGRLSKRAPTRKQPRVRDTCVYGWGWGWGRVVPFRPLYEAQCTFLSSSAFSQCGHRWVRRVGRADRRRLDALALQGTEGRSSWRVASYPSHLPQRRWGCPVNKAELLPRAPVSERGWIQQQCAT